ncbi:MAG: hypothetical protein MHMPM18_003966 [Marteilia pararefringens]
MHDCFTKHDSHDFSDPPRVLQIITHFIFSLKFMFTKATGAALGTLMSSEGIVAGLVVDGTADFKRLIPVIMAGIIGIYGLVTAMVYNSNMKSADGITVVMGFQMLGGGLASGICGLVCGYTIGVVGRAYTSNWDGANNRLLPMMLITLIFSEALALYGLIVGLMV